RWDQLDVCADSLRKRCTEADEIEQISNETLPLLQEVRDHLDDQPRVNRAIAKLDLLRARMNRLGGCYQLIIQLTQTSELKRFQADRKIEATKASGSERQRRQVERDIDNVRSVIEAAREFRELIEQVVAGFEHFAPEIHDQKRRAAA